MAHECPECGVWCYCGGDIDDCGHNFEEDQMACTHCLPAGEDDSGACPECGAESDCESWCPSLARLQEEIDS